MLAQFNKRRSHSVRDLGQQGFAPRNQREEAALLTVTHCPPASHCCGRGENARRLHSWEQIRFYSLNFIVLRDCYLVNSARKIRAVRVRKKLLSIDHNQMSPHH
jgi:hypothetical protein